MFKGFEVQAWFGWIAPIGVPKVIIDKLSAELNSPLRPYAPCGPRPNPVAPG